MNGVIAPKKLLFTIEYEGGECEAYGLTAARRCARQMIEDGCDQAQIVSPKGDRLHTARRDEHGDIVLYGGDTSRRWES